MSAVATTKEHRRRRKRIEKSQRKSSRLWAEGARATILTPHIEPYTDALGRSWVDERDCLARILNEFHQLIDWRLPDYQEPPLPLPAYNPKLVPPPEDLSEEDKQLKSEVLAKRYKVRF